MASFRDVRTLLLDSYTAGEIEDNEFLILYEAHTSKNPDFPYDKYGHFSLDEMDESECKAKFRIEKADLPRLAAALDIPDQFVCPQRSVCDGLEGLCILLRRLAYPCRYSDLIPIFGKPAPVLSMIFNEMLDFVYDSHAHRITDWNQYLLQPYQLQRYSEAIVRQGAPLDNCFGFIDGTVRPVSRPRQMQRVLYNGHKRVHGIKFQSVVLPSGMIGHMFGPVEGKRHDSGMLQQSGLLIDMERFAFSPTGRPMCVYGDPAYPLRVHLQCPFQRANLTQQMMDFNAAMSGVRVSVEWLFGDIINYFKFLDLKKNLKVGLSSVAKMYIVSALLRNGHTCLYRNQTSQFFALDPPTLEEYFA